MGKNTIAAWSEWQLQKHSYILIPGAWKCYLIWGKCYRCAEVKGLEMRGSSWITGWSSQSIDKYPHRTEAEGDLTGRVRYTQRRLWRWRQRLACSHCRPQNSCRYHAWEPTPAPLLPMTPPGQTFALPYPPSFVSVLKNKTKQRSICAVYVLRGGAIHWRMVDLLGAASLKQSDSLPEAIDCH